MKKQLNFICEKVQKIENLVSELQPPQDDIINVIELMRLTGYSRQTIYQKNHNGEIPGVIKFGRFIRFRRSIIISWIENYAQSSKPLQEEENRG